MDASGSVSYAVTNQDPDLKESPAPYLQQGAFLLPKVRWDQGNRFASQIAVPGLPDRG
jgi:hypothetical protein